MQITDYGATQFVDGIYGGHRNFYRMVGNTAKARGLGPWVRGVPETLYRRDDALLHNPHVMLNWAAPIPADR